MGIALLELSYGMVTNFKGEPKKAIAHLEKSIKYCEKGQMVMFLGMAYSHLGESYRLLGKLETAKEYCDKGLKIHIDAGRQSYLSYIYNIQGLIFYDSGDLKNALTCCQKALELSQENNERFYEGSTRILTGQILGRADIARNDEAEQSMPERDKNIGGISM